MSNTRSEMAGGSETPAQWAALVDDRVVWSPQRKVLVNVLKTQGQVEAGRVLMHDHNSPEDMALKDDAVVDLALGNVFYSVPTGDAKHHGGAAGAPKLALFIDDRAVVSTRMDQTGKSLRELFNIPRQSKLVRHREGGRDEAISLEDKAHFGDGPVFRSVVAGQAAEEAPTLWITVNARRFTDREGVKMEMTGFQIAAMAYPDDPQNTSVEFVSDKGREVSKGELIRLRGGEMFSVERVTPTGSVGSF
jgi:hypothetical protein